MQAASTSAQRWQVVWQVGRVEADQTTARPPAHRPVQRMVEVRRAAAQHPAQRLRQCVHHLHRGHGGEHDLTHPEAAGQQVDEVALMAQPGARTQGRGDVVDAERQHGHVENLGRRLAQVRQQIGRGPAGARDELPRQRVVRAQQRGQAARQGPVLMADADAGGGRVTGDQQSQRRPGARKPGPRPGRLGQARRGRPGTPALPDEHWRERQPHRQFQPVWRAGQSISCSASPSAEVKLSICAVVLTKGGASCTVSPP